MPPQHTLVQDRNIHCGEKRSASMLASYSGDVVVLGCCGQEWRLHSRGWMVEVRQQRRDKSG